MDPRQFPHIRFPPRCVVKGKWLEDDDDGIRRYRPFLSSPLFPFRYAAILFKKQRYVSSQHRMNTRIVCKDNFKYEVQERAPVMHHNNVTAKATAVSMQQLAEEYWRIDKFFLISFPILFFIFNIIYWLAFLF